jgi:hypothetical protein
MCRYSPRRYGLRPEELVLIEDYTSSLDGSECLSELAAPFVKGLYRTIWQFMRVHQNITSETVPEVVVPSDSLSPLLVNVLEEWGYSFGLPSVPRLL